MKKILLGLGTIATIAAPLTTIVACSAESNGTKETDMIMNNETRKFINISADQTPMFETLGNGIKNTATNLLANKIVSKIELNVIDKQVKFSYKTPSISIDELEDESEVTYPIIAVTIQLGGSPTVIKIESLSEKEEVIKDITSEEKQEFDKSKINELVSNLKNEKNSIDSGISEIKNNDKFNNYPTNGIHVLDQGKRMNSLFIKDREGIPNSKHVVLSPKTLAISEEIRKIMNENHDAQWHTYGDPILDGTNAVRLAIHDDLKGDRKLKELIRDFSNEAFAKWRAPFNKENTNVYEEFVKGQINDWFDSKAGMPNLVGGAWGEMGKAGKANDLKGMKEVFSEPSNIEKMDKNTNYRALTLGTQQILTTEHRAQELDWYGDFDGHGHAATIKKIKDKVKMQGDRATGEYSKAPTGDEGQGLENYVFSYTYNDHKFSEGADFTCGLLAAIDVLYDYADGGRETGHRTNLFGKDLTTFGWAWHANNKSNFQYLVTVVGVNTAQPISNVDEIKSKNPFLNDYSIEMLRNVTPISYLNKTCEWDKNDYTGLPGAWGEWFGEKVDKIFHTSHSSFEKFWADIVTVIGEGNNEKVRFNQPTKSVEVQRFAVPQVVGKPDKWVKAYDYNGGGTLTGHQCGYSPIDGSLFQNMLSQMLFEN